MNSTAKYERLLEENRLLKGKLRQAEIELEVWRKGKTITTDRGRVPMSPRSPSPDEERFPRGVSRKRSIVGLDDLVAQVVDGGKKRRVGGRFDPEKKGILRLPAMVKIGGVVWEDGIGGVSAALEEAGVEECDGTRWLVPEGELTKRKERGSLSSTVVARVKGVDVAGQLCRTGLWVGGRWCSVRRYVAVPPKKREPGWVRVVGKVKDVVEDRLVKGIEVAILAEREMGKGRSEGLEGLMKEVRADLRTLKSVGDVGKGSAGDKERVWRGKIEAGMGVMVKSTELLATRMEDMGDMMAVLLDDLAGIGKEAREAGEMDEDSDDGYAGPSKGKSKG